MVSFHLPDKFDLRRLQNLMGMAFSPRYSTHAVVVALILILTFIYIPFPSISGSQLPVILTEHIASTTKNIIGKNAAAIIDDRPLEELIPILLHFLSILGPAWPIIVFTSQSTIPVSAPFHRAIDELRLSVKFLPADITFSNQHAVSEFLTSSWLWEQLEPAGHVLLFQADSILCGNSPLQVEDFTQYDFVGAPIDVSLGHGEGYNGGLSLRNRTMVLDIIATSSWRGEYDTAENKQIPWVEFEDQWLYHKMKGLPNKSNGEPGARLPSVDVAGTFSVETLWYDNPLGYHQVERWNSDRLGDVDKWCPERRLASGDLLISKGG